MKNKSKMSKIKTLVLSLGYVESESQANLIMRHNKGFDSLQEALMSIREAMQEYIDRRIQELEISLKRDSSLADGNHYKKYLKDAISSLKSSSVEHAFVNFFLGYGGSDDSGIILWENLGPRGWETGWNKDIDLKCVVQLDHAEGHIQDCNGWGEGPLEDYMFEIYGKPNCKLLKDS